MITNNNKYLTIFRACLLFGILIGSAILSGCYGDKERYFARRDTITVGAGDAVNTNKVTHTVNPWPRHAKNDKIKTDGQRASKAIEEYRGNKTKEPKNLVGSSDNAEPK